MAVLGVESESVSEFPDLVLLLSDDLVFLFHEPAGLFELYDGFRVSGLLFLSLEVVPQHGCTA